MTSKQLVYAAIRRQNPERVPRFLWFHPDLLQQAGKRFGTSGFATEVALGNDILQPWVSINGSMARHLDDGESFVDEFGITWTRRGLYNTPTHHPLENAGAIAIQDYPMPDPAAPERFRELDRLIEQFGDTHFIGVDVSGSIFEPAYHLRNLPVLLADMAEGAAEAEALLDRTMHFTTVVAEECLHRNVDWIWLGDDVGIQTGMLLSPTSWCRLLKPRLKQIVDRLRSLRPDVIIAYHSCGSIRPIIPDLVEIGISLLNPLQPMAADMDNLAIKREFGSTLGFMAGIDTQNFLPYASPQEVCDETKRIIDAMGEGGGFIFAGSHTIQPDVPWPNIDAMLKALNVNGYDRCT